MKKHTIAYSAERSFLCGSITVTGLNVRNVIIKALIINSNDWKS